MGAMGAQALTALRETPDIRLVTDGPLPVAAAVIDDQVYILEEHGPVGRLPATLTAAASIQAKPSIFMAAAVARQRSAQSARMAALEADNAELRGEVAHLSRQLEEAREQGRRDEREVKARTMGGRVLSIFVGGNR